ncbi:MAG: hypothetical protein GKR94_26195 [Gammaproteobacteria bacterium]|nr:hypothetical protein [Gammaproteobacteria bacterium]
MSHLLDHGFLIRPLEAVYFGRPRSFSAGEAHHGTSEFPPSGYTFQGMIRSQLLRAVHPPLDLDDASAAARDQRTRLVGGPDALPAGWQLTGPYPARIIEQQGGERRLQPWLPAPHFLLAAPAPSSGIGGSTSFDPEPCARPATAAPVHARALPDACGHALNDLKPGTVLLGRPDEGAVKALGGWLTPANLRHALSAGGHHSNGDPPWCAAGHACGLPPFVHRETRPGLALEDGSARDGMLYFLDTVRFHDADGARAGLYGHAGFYGHIEGKCDERIPANALIATLGAAGRKARPAAFEPIPPLVADFENLCNDDHLPATVHEKDCFWLVILTPVALDDPAMPLPAGRDGVRLESLGLLTGPALTIGGYRYADASTRPNRSYLPAGSCWLIRLRGADPERRARILRTLNNAHLLGDEKEAAFGFGHTLVGLAPPCEETL